MASVTTALGPLRGRDADGCEMYLGIPFAQPPVGDRRFRPPEPMKPWDGELDATRFRATCWQPTSGSSGFLPGAARPMDEDCLVLNIYTPRADSARRPVLMWIHGGAYVTGSGDLYDGRSFARIGDIVVVTINYRLGPFGFVDWSALDPSYAGAENNGIRDQIEALRWVRDHIADFGGDPEQVTICGESAGAGSVMALLAAPTADGLFHRAIAQSAPAGFGASNAGLPHRLVAALGDTDPREATPEELIAAHDPLAAGDASDTAARLRLIDGNTGYHPVVDGDLIPRPVVEAVAGGTVPLMLGTNVDEGTLFGMAVPKDITDDVLRSAVADHSHDPDRVLTAFRQEFPDHSNQRLAIEMLTDTLFRTSSLAVADAAADAGRSVHVYRFSWQSQGFGGALGATHALEIPFVWNGDLKAWAALMGEGEPWPPGLAMQMHRAWISFVRSGDPNHVGIPDWPRYDTDTRPTMDFGDIVELLDDPRGATRACW